MRYSQALRLDKESDLVQGAKIHRIEDGVSWGLERMLLINHVLHELAHHLSRHAGPVSGVLEHQRAWILPVRLEPNLFKSDQHAQLHQGA